MAKNNFLIISSLIMILASVFLWSYMGWRNAHPGFGPTQVISLDPDLEGLPMTFIPVLTEQLQATTTSTASGVIGLPPAPPITARAAVAIDLDSGVTLLEKNPNLALPPASSIKMLTALIARETYSLDQILTITPQDLTQSNAINLTAGEQLTVADLLQAMLVNSSNESAQALANHSPQGATVFMQQMNEKAQALHLNNTQALSPEGFDYEEQKTSARDLALLAQELLRDSYLAEIVALPRTTILAATGEIHELDNTNQFLANPPTLSLIDGRRLSTTFSGIKTGTTPAAGEVLVTLATVDGHRLLLVVLGSQNRYTDSTQILTWIFNNYTWLDSRL